MGVFLRARIQLDKWPHSRPPDDGAAGWHRPPPPAPPFASQTFVQWFKARGGSPPESATEAPGKPGGGQVVLFPDTFTNYNHPELGRAAVKVMEALGYQVIVPPIRCCGRPMLSKGMMDRARDNARYNVDLIHRYVESGAMLVGIEPSCILSFSDDYTDLTGVDSDRAKAIAGNTMLVEQFVDYAIDQGAELNLDGSRLPEKILLHGHCHQKALVGTGPAMRVPAVHRRLRTHGDRVPAAAAWRAASDSRQSTTTSPCKSGRCRFSPPSATRKEILRSSPRASLAASRSPRAPANAPATWSKFWPMRFKGVASEPVSI